MSRKYANGSTKIMIELLELPAADLLHELLAYNSDIGIFIWKPRLPRHFTDTKRRTAEQVCHWWNNKFAGTQAGVINREGYRVIRVNSVSYSAHRLAWLMIYGKSPEFIDHINGVTSDNRLINIRSVTWGDNLKNKKRLRNNTSGISGVCYYKPTHTWQARINHEGKRIHLGYFSTKEMAITARKAAEVIYGYHANHGRD